VRVIELRPQAVLVGNLVIPTTSPRRQWWHQMPDRHWKRAATDRTLIGKKVLVSRIIIRCGYFWEYTDVAHSQLRDTVDNIMISKLATVLNLTRTEHDEMMGLSGQRKASQIISRLEKEFGYGVYRRAVYTARKLWLNAIYDLPEYKPYRHIRTFWYVNLTDVTPEPRLWLRVQAVQQHIVGMHFPPSSYYHSGPDGDDYDYTPGGIAPGVQQGVYTSRILIRNYGDYYDGPCEIHPLDVEEIE